MNPLEFRKNELQIDYFSESYRRFERDFYRYSALNIPLTFLTDDILVSMAQSQKNYFRLNKENAKDRRDHYFLFTIEHPKDNPFVRLFRYEKTVTSI